MKYEIINKIEKDYLKQIVKIHYDSLSYRSFITNFGESFLFQLYISILKKKLGFLVCASEDNQVIGFILACIDSSKIFPLVFKKFYIFLPLIIGGILKKPNLILNLLQTFLYKNKAITNIKAELLVIAVKENYRSKGLGGSLLKLFEDRFRELGIERYKVTVHKDMLASNNFYLNHSMKLLKTFNLYGVTWNVYVKDLV
ncbi:MAG: GNAT family N-acetyltransferase [bacterium]